jgi:hypothetical protein
MQAKARKVEVQTKLTELQKDIAQLSELSEADVAAEDEATVKLHQVWMCPPVGWRKGV